MTVIRLEPDDGSGVTVPSAYGVSLPIASWAENRASRLYKSSAGRYRCPPHCVYRNDPQPRTA
ncbi:hypothetical protein DOTSEDRAFT_75298 [Dothistroma septosporum NZE10]|uniref:Uncharacterized protein n=1 Tax=Dothistroma septosporum (strain NZE10 / CBS 128990) TaxID=675120 RepID=M2XJG0_DOTSN|nr:hypothetical protein DOTSEDRAFT_75298 [Dothistroma septosporum NZE10]